MQSELAPDSPSVRGDRLDRRLHDIAWGLLLVITGIIWLVPNDRVPQGAWLWAVAAVLFGVNIARSLNHIKVNAFSMALGLAASIAALTQFFRHDLPLLAICLIVIGASLLAKPLLTRAG